MPSSSQLSRIVAPAVEMLGFEFITCEIHPQGKRVILRILIDSPQGIKIEDCEKVSRQISAVLDVEDPMLGKFDLEVSSPGADRPLVSKEHFQRFVGHRVRIKLRQSQNERRNYTGILDSVQDESIQVIVDGDAFVLSLSEIEKANLVPDVRGSS